MRLLHLILFLLLPASVACAQTQAEAPPAPVAAATKGVPAWRDTSNYLFPAIAKTVTDLQNVAYAMTLRDYCADRRVPDDFVRERLTRFSAMTGREETCRSLMDY